MIAPDCVSGDGSILFLTFYSFSCLFVCLQLRTFTGLNKHED